MSFLQAHSHIMIDVAGPELSPDECHLLQNYDVGGICLFRRNIIDRIQVTELCEQLRTFCGDDVLIATDQEGGTVVRATEVPHAAGSMALGAIDDLSITKQAGQLTARGLKHLGINLNFAPVADVNNNPLNPVIGDRSYGANPTKVAEHVAAFVQGLQQEGVAATLKHFPGHGDTAIDSHLELPKLDVSLSRLEEVELVPFKSGIQSGAACVMSYHGLIPVLDAEYPGTLSRKVMTSLLRERLGFEGVCITDALEMEAIARQYSIAEAAILALNAGNDLALYDVHESGVAKHEAVFKAMDKALQDGLLNIEELTVSKKRLEKLITIFPSKPNSEIDIWQSGDREFMQQCDQQAVTVVGALAVLTKGQAITVVAARGEVGGGASDFIASPVHNFLEVLEDSGFKVEVCFYDADDVSVDISGKIKDKTVLFVTAGRTRPSKVEIELARGLEPHSNSFTHIALWNPYTIEDIPKPAILSFGFSATSLEKVAKVLLGEAAKGTLPF